MWTLILEMITYVFMIKTVYINTRAVLNEHGVMTA